MHYRSTRGTDNHSALLFSHILLSGLAPDGGLYLPTSWPQISRETFNHWRGLSYPDLVAEILSLFTAGDIELDALKAMSREAYKNFSHAAIVPLNEVETGLFSLELFHGPTLAFKDMAMQMLGQLFEYVLEREDRYVTIVGATSGDTGSAAIEAFKGKKRVNIVILHPLGRTSEVQRRQMTTVLDDNVLNIAIEGDFDNCQDMVKAMFADSNFRQSVSLSAVNSINWARIACQIPYYIRSALTLGAPERAVSFAVPTGNFGNILAAWAAGQMGLPIRKLQVGSNKNDILTRFLLSNDMSVQVVEPSLSPSMDIQVSSNFERLLFEMLEQDPHRCNAIMQEFRQTGRMAVPHDAWEKIRENFNATCLDDEQTIQAMRHFFENSHYIADPHSAIGLEAGRQFKEADIAMIVAATAHPAKFPDAVKKATGQDAALPPHLADLFARQERFITLPNELAAVQNAIKAHVQNQ
ncbi:threonine synthase [Aristophania vespae]|uniref:threonine synthase n=1 Tax=Aristophania vespae TaxID=2697033 RepID=UPI0023518B83|nr:threonine synthase [Aristophania vespae]